MKNKFSNYIEHTSKNKMLLVFLILTICIYLPSLYFDFFVFDDKNNILTKPSEYTFYDFIIKWKITKIPLSHNYWQLIGSLFGNESPLPYRLSNIIFHCINGLLIYEVFKKVLKSNKSATLISGLFLIHPIGVQSVIWASSAREILATLFTLISVNIFLSSNQSNKSLLMSFIFWLGSILFKPISLVLPLLIPLFYKNKKSIKTNLFIVFCFCTIVVFLFLYIGEISKSIPYEHHSFSNLLGSYAITTVLYLKNYFFPFFLEFNYSITPTHLNEIITSFKFIYYLSILLFILITLKLAKNDRYLYAMIAFFLLIAINSGLVPFGHQIISTVTDRYLYFPSIALAFIISTLILNTEKSKQIYLISAISIILTFTSFSEINKWKTSSDRLYREKSDNHIQKISYANALIWDKKYAEAFLYIDNHLQTNELNDSITFFDYLSVRLSLFNTIPKDSDYHSLKNKINSSLSKMQPELYPLIANFAFQNQDFNLARKAYIYSKRNMKAYLVDFNIETLDKFQEMYEDKTMTEATLIPSSRNADHISKKLYQTFRPFITEKLLFDNAFKNRN